MITIRFFLILALLSLSACSNHTTAFIAQPATQPEQAMVYIYRPASLSNIAVSPSLEISDVQSLIIENNRHYSLPLDAGSHRITLKPGERYIGQHQLLRNIQAGEIIFLKITTSIQFEKNKPYTRRFDITEVSAETAQKEISQTKFIENEEERKSAPLVTVPLATESEKTEFSINKTRNPFSN